MNFENFYWHDAIIKNIEVINENVEIGDQTNMGFSGSIVSNGQGIGIVVATGENTELGKISQLMKDEGIKSSPLQERSLAFRSDSNLDPVLRRYWDAIAPQPLLLHG